MRNLEIVRRRIYKNLFSPQDTPIICTGEDSQAYLCSKDQHRIFRVATNTSDVHTISETVYEDEILKGAHHMQYVSTTGHLFISTDDGGFFQGNDTGSELTELFKSEQQIENFSVSSDSRLVAILTKVNTVLLLTLPDLECIAQHENTSDNTGKQELPELLPGGSIVWRKDSRFFAINTCKSSTSTNDKEVKSIWNVKIYSEDGSLHSQACLEDCNLISPILAWQPSGGLLASFGNTPHGNGVIFFELNGLKRSQLLVSKVKNVENVVWNSASDILALQCDTYVELWVRNNYVWMLKTTLRDFEDGENNQVLRIGWDCELPYRLYIFFKNGNLITYDVAFKYCSGHSKGASLSVWWNGANAYCTPFRDNLAPPPYGHLQIQLKSNIVSTMISDFWDGFLAVTEFDGIVLVRRHETELQNITTFVLPKEIKINSIDSWTWLNDATVCCTSEGALITFNADGGKLISVEEPDNRIRELHLSKRICVNDEKILRVISFTEASKESLHLLVETNYNSIFLANIHTQSVTLIQKSSQMFANIGYINLPEENNIFTFFHDPLTRSLYIGSSKSLDGELQKLSSDCTSFVTFSDNILLSTLSGSLEIFNRTQLVDMFKRSTSQNVDEGKYSRKLEKGSVIVACCINQMLEPSLTLQVIPRGNLETICPRPLLVSCIRMTLRETDKPNKYEKVMTALRRHRLDYRVLIDEITSIASENPEMTIQKALESMLEQVQDSHSLVLLVTDLDDSYENSIRIIKDLLEKHIIDNQIRKPNVEEAYLAALAKLGLLEEALKSRLIFGENNDERNLVTHRVKFLSYYCDNPDILFDTSLGTYDLSLASLVADCLGKDPKEFLPMLDELNALTDFKRKFRIDDKLRRFSKAVIYLVQDESVQHSEVLKYLQRHRLFTDVIEYINSLIDSSNSCTRSIGDLQSLLLETKVSYGNYLEEHTKFKEACILYRGGNEHEMAINCAIKSGEWETALEIFYCHLSGKSEISIERLSDKLLEKLEESKDYSSAARICETYLKDDMKAISYLIRDKNWRRAKCLAYKNTSAGDKCLIEMIKPKVQEAANERNEYLITLIADVSQHFNRWRTVKEIKARKLLELDGGMDDNDTFSDADSVSSVSSRSSASSGKTARSGKSKRKLERKLYSLKEGSHHEDLALTVHLWNIFDKIQSSLKSDTSELLICLWEFGENELAKSIGTLFDSLLSECTVTVNEIWSTILTDELLDKKYRLAPIAWTSSWEKLCLHDPSSKATKH